MGDNQADESSRETGPQRVTKVERLIDEYDLGEKLGAELEALWTATGDERMSLRSLADLFNKRLLETAMRDAGMSILDGEIENLYRLVNSDDVSSGKYTEARNQLEQGGVDVDQLERDFVTYQAIRSYLQNERDAEHENRTDDDRLTGATESVQRLKSRTQSVCETTLTQLRSADIITLDDFRLFVDIKVHCEGCNTQFGIVELLREGGCNCMNS